MSSFIPLVKRGWACSAVVKAPWEELHRGVANSRITLPAIHHLSVSSGNDNRLKIGEKSPKPIGKGTQIQKNENRQFIVDNRCKPNDLSLRLLKMCFDSGKNIKV